MITACDQALARDSFQQVTALCQTLAQQLTARLLVVQIQTQRMLLLQNMQIQRAFTISTSARPPCNEKDSLGTPRGLHRICECIGKNQPLGMIFKGRVTTGICYPQAPQTMETNLITSRILRLQGLQPGINLGGNVDTFERLVYIHGTNQEDLIGTPQSHGCVVMRNQEIIELFEQVTKGDLLWIVD